MHFLQIIVALAAASITTASAATATSSAFAASGTPMGPWEMLLQQLVHTRLQSQAQDQTVMTSEYAWLPMNVTTPVIPGGPNVTLYGDTKSINAQILKMNPNYKVDDFIAKSDAIIPPGEPKTAVLPPKCNNWPESGSLNLLEEGIVDLNSSSYPVVVPINSCVALSCIDGASIGLCNDNPEPITKITKNLVVYLEALANYCISSTGTVNGQIFDTGKFNLVYNKGSCKPGNVEGSNYQGNNDPGAPLMGSPGTESGAPASGSGGLRIR